LSLGRDGAKGIRLALRPDFDVTPEAAPGPPQSAEVDGGIPLGEVLDRNMMPAGVFTLSIPVALVSPSVAPYIWISLLPLRLFARARAGRSSQGRTHAA